MYFILNCRRISFSESVRMGLGRQEPVLFDIPRHIFPHFDSLHRISILVSQATVVQETPVSYCELSSVETGPRDYLFVTN